MTSETYLNASQAAQRTGKSVVTIRHYLATNQLPNAKQTDKGKVKIWAIPLTDLVAAGLLDKVSSGSKKPSATNSAEQETLALDSRVASLENELKLTRELLARADRELDDYRLRERQLFSAIETRDTQERRRFGFFRRTVNPQETN